MSKELQRSKIMELEASMRQQEGAVVGDGPAVITHYFAPGIYCREMFVPAGYALVGKIHKTKHICILSKGKVTVADGETLNTYEAPTTIVSPVGAKRAIYAHEDSVWTNVHSTGHKEQIESELESIEKELIAESFEELDGYLEQIKDEK